jgi:ACS family D-galactonate transporter-like MFS transporter
MFPSGPTASEIAPAAIPRRRWGVALLLGFGVLVNYFDRINLSVAYAALRNEFGITALTFGYLLSAYSWTYAICQVPSGVLLDRYGVRRVGRISAFIWSVASFAAALATGIWGFLSARFLLGIGEAPTFPANAKAIGYWFPKSERSLATAIFDSAAKFSSAIGVPIMGLVLIRFGWRWSFAATGVVSLVYFLLFHVFYRNPSEDPRLSDVERQYIVEGGAQPEGAASRFSESSSLPYLIAQPKILGLCLGFAAYNYSFYFLLTWLPSYFLTGLGLNLFHSVFFTSVPWLFATVADLAVGGFLVDALIRRGRDPAGVRRTVLVVGMMFGVAIIGAATTRSATAAVFWITLALAGLSASAPVAWSIPSLIAPRNSVGRVGGILNFCSQIAAIAAPIVTGYIVALTHSFRWAFAGASLFLLVGIAGYGLLLGDMKPIADESL